MESSNLHEWSTFVMIMIGAVDVNLAISQELAQRIEFIFIRLGAHLKQIIFLVLNNEQ